MDTFANPVVKPTGWKRAQKGLRRREEPSPRTGSLDPMTASGLLSESLFKIVDCGGHDEFVELTVPSERVNSGAEPSLDGRNGSQPPNAGCIFRCPTVRCRRDSTRRIADAATTAERPLN